MEIKVYDNYLHIVKYVSRSFSFKDKIFDYNLMFYMHLFMSLAPFSFISN